jgi:hypothetical protein
VLYTDVDEIVVPAPAYGDLGRYLDEFNDEFVNLPRMGSAPRPQNEPPLDPAVPILAQTQVVVPEHRSRQAAARPGADVVAGWLPRTHYVELRPV